jgi:uncharacterized protein (DUF1684 family)
MPESRRATLDVIDWRRQVWSLYADVRRIAVADPAEAHQVWRDGRDDLFAHHPASPLLPETQRSFVGLPVAAYDPKWRLEVELQKAETSQIEMSTGSDGDVPFERIARVAVGSETLDVWRLQSYGGGIFVPVRDGLAGQPGGTYGGGRYLLDTIKGADLGNGSRPGSLVLDFNFAYNPSCAYDPEWACPLAPGGNILRAEIAAGELYREVIAPS